MNPQEILAEIAEHLRGMSRYKWWAIAVAWFISLGAWFSIYTMPNVYGASAKVYVDTDSLIGPVFDGLAIRDNVRAQVQAVNRALLTRPNLESVARRTDLDLRADTPAEMEQLITGLQVRIQVRGNREQNVFDVSFEDPNRAKARDVVSAIVDAFVENSLQGRGEDAEMTERALMAEIADHEQRLTSAETALAEFKKENLGYMPDDRGDYYTRLQTTLASVKTLEEEQKLLVERRDELRRQIEGEEPVFGIMSMGPGPSSVGCTQQGQIAELQSQLAILRVNFTDRHPRIQTLQESIAVLEEQCGAERQASAAAGVPVSASPDTTLEANPVYQNMRIQLSETEVELASLRAQLSAGKEEVATLRRDVDKIAEVEANLKQLNRDYGVVQTRYQELLKRRETFRSAQRLDPVTDTVQFRILEPPFAPVEPVGPPRQLLIAASTIMALGVGLAIAFVLHQFNPVFFTRRSLKKVAGLPVLGSVSLLTTTKEAAARKRRIWAFAASLGFLLLAMGAVIVLESRASSVLRNMMGGIGV